MKCKQLGLLACSFLLIGILSAQTNSNKWKNLFDGNPQDHWDVFIGAPHATVKGLEGVDPNSNGINSKPLGLNNDPKNVFNFETIDGEQVLHISGEIYGALTSKNEYGNFANKRNR